VPLAEHCLHDREPTIVVIVVIGVRGDDRRQSISVHLHCRRFHPVPIADRLDQAGRQPAPQPEHVGLQRRRWIARQLRRPQHVNGGPGRHHPAAVEHQEREETPLQDTVRSEIAPLGVGHPDRAENLRPNQVAGAHSPNLDRCPWPVRFRRSEEGAGPPILA
jgi:hypothetical protein